MRQTAQYADKISDHPHPSWFDAVLFRGKVTLLQLRRSVQDGLSHETDRYPRANELVDRSIIAESITPIWTAAEPSEQYLLAGKAHNLRIILRRLNGIEVPPNGTFSFWKQLGRVTRRRGFVAGREVREGCIIPNIGGGLCQLSNALYDAALSAGFEIVERHAHSRVIPGSLAEVDRDATVFWNYVDLRFRSPEGFRIEAFLTGDSLIVRFRGTPRLRLHQIGRAVRAVGPSKAFSDAAELHSCVTCNTQDCFRHVPPTSRETSFGRAAFLVDDYWPEFDRYLDSIKRESDLLCLPLDGRQYGKSNYAWGTDSFRQVNQHRLFTLYRSHRSRRLAHQGAARQRALLANYERLAHLYSKYLTYEVTHVTLMQQLLPYLWREGHLGGRTFDVLMTSLPMQTLQDRLDAAAALHPESMTLADFRADRQLVQAETEALQQARRIVTPHTEIARLFPDKAMLIDWEIPKLKRNPSESLNSPAFLFPAATVGRKGAYELREALQGLNMSLAITGPMLEAADFWRGVNVRLGRFSDWMGNTAAVVLPAFIEHQPRRLLEAVAHGVPVIASTACGLENVSGVISVQPGDVDSLRAALMRLLPAS